MLFERIRGDPLGGFSPSGHLAGPIRWCDERMTVQGTQYDLEPTVPAFFDSPLSVVLIAWFLMLAISIRSIQLQEERLGAGGAMAWIVVVIVGGPLGVLAWFSLGYRTGRPPAPQGPTPFS